MIDIKVMSLSKIDDYYILYIRRNNFYILIILSLFVYSEFHGENDFQSTEGLNKKPIEKQINKRQLDILFLKSWI